MSVAMGASTVTRQPARESAPSWAADLPLYRLSVKQYHAMIDAGVLQENGTVEFLDGLLVEKMGKNGAHCVALDLLRSILLALLPAGWILRLQDPVALDWGEPEPDAVIASGQATDYRATHPTPDRIVLVVEVADSSLKTDRGVKLAMYARNGLPVYWIVNLLQNQVEVYSQPTGPIEEPDYLERRVYRAGERVPLLVGNQTAEISVSDFLR